MIVPLCIAYDGNRLTAMRKAAADLAARWNAFFFMAMYLIFKFKYWRKMVIFGKPLISKSYKVGRQPSN